MSLILTFLGKGGSGKTTIAIASAQKLAQLGAKVLLVGQDSSPTWAIQVGTPLTSSPAQIAPNLSVVQLQTTLILERSWEELKKLEDQYLRSPALKNVYGQELGILPGMDEALALNALREYDKTGEYDVIVYDGTGDMNTLRMFGIPEIAGWYGRRFRQVLANSEIVKILAPFFQPITSAILNVSWSPDDLDKQSSNQASNLLEEGRKALENPQRVLAYLVTTEDSTAQAMAKYLWGGAQQVGLSVGGLILNRSQNAQILLPDFSALPITLIPGDSPAIYEFLPDFRTFAKVAKPLIVDAVNRQVKVFLPGFEKRQVKLSQSGPELTIEAGDQRRNIDVPENLRGQPVKGAKFQDSYLIISF